MFISRSLLALCIPAVASSLHAARAAAQASSSYCLPQAEFKLAGVSPRDSAPVVRRALGAPQRVVRDTAQDDGGKYEVRHLAYRNVSVELGRGRVERVRTSSPTVTLPSGIRVGISLEQVAHGLRWAEATHALRGDTLTPILCRDGPHEPDLAALDIIFGPPSSSGSRRVVAIIASEFGP